MKKRFFASVLISSLLFGGIATYAEAIDALFNKIIVKVNGETVKAENVLINGRTYVPLRAISEILNKDVIWDAKTSTADIKTKIAPGWTEVISFSGKTSKKTESFKIEGSQAKLTWENIDASIFSITLYNASTNKYESLIANTMDKQKEITYIKEPGEYYLDIGSTGNYKILIEQMP